jgi:hypothetical protein
VYGAVRLLLRRLRPVLGAADRDTPGRVSTDGWRRQRDRGEEKDLAPDREQRRRKTDCRFQPLERDRVSFKHSPHRRSFNLPQENH